MSSILINWASRVQQAPEGETVILSDAFTKLGFGHIDMIAWREGSEVKAVARDENREHIAVTSDAYVSLNLALLGVIS